MSEYKKIILFLLKNIPQNNTELVKILRKKSGEFKIAPPRKAKLLKAYHELQKNKQISSNPQLEILLKKRSIRTLSGVAPITVMTAPLSCPANCLYCPSEKNMPKSYLSNQPAAMRAVLSDFDPFKQTHTRLKALKENGHDTDKIEIIINGGTWSSHPENYQVWYIKEIFRACNHYQDENNDLSAFIDYKKSKNIIKQKLSQLSKIPKQLQNNNSKKLLEELKKEQQINETGQNRIIGITLETRPDHITAKELSRMRTLGATKVEIGVQTIYQDVADLNRRNQTVSQVINATKLLKDAGFKVAYHMMPGMYGSTPQKDIAMFKEIFANPDFKPDFLKIYPCVVVKESDLYKIFQKGSFVPYSTETLIDTLIRIKQYIPKYCRLSRLHRDIPKESIAGGCDISNLREMLNKKMTQKNISCQCIRCREPMNTNKDIKRANIHIQEFKAAKIKEYFISFDSIDDKHIYAFLRLRMPSENKNIYKKIPELNNAAIIREIHTYGKLTPLHTKNAQKTIQHLGFGKRLMKQAENIARQNGAKKMAVIAGIGVREYYKKQGYSLEGTYMVKNL